MNRSLVWLVLGSIALLAGVIGYRLGESGKSAVTTAAASTSLPSLDLVLNVRFGRLGVVEHANTSRSVRAHATHLLVHFVQDLPAAVLPYVFSDHCNTQIVKARHGDSSGVRGAAWLPAMS